MNTIIDHIKSYIYRKNSKCEIVDTDGDGTLTNHIRTLQLKNNR